jgi:high-affinity K+ transport system ATPase subunit B
MNLNSLTQPQWAATLHAARILRECNPQDAEDRARFRAARNRLAGMLPDGAPDKDLIAEAVRWYAMNDFAAAFVGLPVEAVQ